MMKNETIKIKLNENGEPILPEGWTFLIHGTSTAQWSKETIENESFIVKGNEAGLYCVEREKAIENEKNGSNVSKLHSELKQKEGEKSIEIRCLIYKDLRRQKDREEFSDKLTEKEINDINNYHVMKPYYPAIPNNTKLIKVATTQFDEITKEDKEIIWYIPENYLEHYKEDVELIKENNNQQKQLINGKQVEIKVEKERDFEKTTRFLDGVEINSNKEYKDGSYDKKSKVFVDDKITKASNKYINYTMYKQQYDAENQKYTDNFQEPVIDKDGVVIGKRQYTEIYETKSSVKNQYEHIILDNENGNYEIENRSIMENNRNKQLSAISIDNKLSGSKEKIQYLNENGKESYLYMENGVIGQKITKTERGITIDMYKDGKPDITYEYDEKGKAIIQMGEMDQLPEDYVRQCFENVIPDYEVILHKEPEEIYMIDENSKEKENFEKVISTQKLGKETLDIQKDVGRIDSIEEKINNHIMEQTKQKEEGYIINEFGEIIRPEENNFRESIKVHLRTSTDEEVDKILNDFEQGIVEEKQEEEKKYSHKVEKGDNDYIR